MTPPAPMNWVPLMMAAPFEPLTVIAPVLSTVGWPVVLASPLGRRKTVAAPVVARMTLLTPPINRLLDVILLLTVSAPVLVMVAILAPVLSLLAFHRKEPSTVGRVKPNKLVEVLAPTTLICTHWLESGSAGGPYQMK